PPSLGASWAAVHETHIGAVFLVGDLGYKLKKPVDLGFLDFSARETRERVCHREVELNRRLAPDVYLGVADVTGPDGSVCDHLVVMRRMPQDRRLAERIRSGEDVEGELRSIAKRVAAFHAGAATSREISEAGSPAAVLANWDANF